MKVAMMQPAFLPWQGFFELIFQSDRFIFLDDFQFSVQSYHQRNRLFVNRGQVSWCTVPVKKSVSFKAPLNQTKINESMPWRAKMWKSIQLNYSKTPYYEQIAPEISSWLFDPAESLGVQNINFIKMVCKILGLERNFMFSSYCQSAKTRSERVLELLEWAQASSYYCARGSFEYMKKDGIFPISGIEVLFQNFQPQPYFQVGSPNSFIPFLSVLDALLNVGPVRTRELIRTGTSKWQSWDEMIVLFNKDSSEG